MTNAEWIKQLNDKQLANFLYHYASILSAGLACDQFCASEYEKLMKDKKHIEIEREIHDWLQEEKR